MTSKNVANVGSIVTDKTIDSQSLLEMVNQARKQCGEKRFVTMSSWIALKTSLRGSFTRFL